MAKTNYSKMSKKSEVEETPITTLEIEEVEVDNGVSDCEIAPEETSKPETIGVVIDCGRLNVRVKPSSNADIICTVQVGSQLMIDPEKSTTDWLSVCTAAGTEGFCMAKFVKIEP